MYDILVIGSGPAGLTAAIYAVRGNKSVAVVTGTQIGGQLITTSEIENYPGFVGQGFDLMHSMYEQAQNLGVVMLQESAISIKKDADIFIITTNYQTVEAKVVILATGSTPKMLGIEKDLVGKGVSTCATCDGNFYKNKKVAVVGGGNCALEEAIYLANIVSHVYLIHRRAQFRAEHILQERLKQFENISFLIPYIVTEFISQKTLNAVKIKNLETNNEEILEISACFIAIGHTPNTQLVENLVALDEAGYIKNGPMTEVPGLFVAGDVFDSKYRQAITAAGFGCIAAIEALKYL